MPYYIEDPKRDPNFDNHPHRTQQGDARDVGAEITDLEVAGSGQRRVYLHSLKWSQWANAGDDTAWEAGDSSAGDNFNAAWEQRANAGDDCAGDNVNPASEQQANGEPAASASIYRRASDAGTTVQRTGSRQRWRLEPGDSGDSGKKDKIFSCSQSAASSMASIVPVSAERVRQWLAKFLETRPGSSGQPDLISQLGLGISAGGECQDSPAAPGADIRRDWHGCKAQLDNS